MALILVTGANGQLGQEIKRLSFTQSSNQFEFLSRDQLDIANTEAVLQKFEESKPDFCINCAAYTAVDKAETEKDIAYSINGRGPQNLSKAAKQANTKLIHISTDYVFNGTSNRPYKETDAVDPVNAYGASKLMGEQLAMEENSETIIIRTSWVYSSFGNNFVKTMLRLMASKPEISVVSDQQGSPTYAADLAHFILELVKMQKWLPGIYHYSNEGIISWYDFALEIRNYINANCIVNPIPTEAYPTPAKRPYYSVMDKTKIQQTFQLHLQDWKESLHKCLDLLTV